MLSQKPHPPPWEEGLFPSLESRGGKWGKTASCVRWQPPPPTSTLGEVVNPEFTPSIGLSLLFTSSARVLTSLLKSLLEEGMATHSSILAGELHGQRSLVCYSPWGHKESDMTERLTHTSSSSFHRQNPESQTWSGWASLIQDSNTQWLLRISVSCHLGAHCNRLGVPLLLKPGDWVCRPSSWTPLSHPLPTGSISPPSTPRSQSHVGQHKNCFREPRWRRNRTGRPLSPLQIHPKNTRTQSKLHKTTSDR